MGESEGFDLIVADDQTSYGYPAYTDGSLSDCYNFDQYPTDGVVSIKQTTPPCYADCNCDTKVNLADLVIMKQQFTWTCSQHPSCEADCNGDGKVDLTDLVIMKTQFLRIDCQPCP
jgi:hypothetical protein